MVEGLALGFFFARKGVGYESWRWVRLALMPRNVRRMVVGSILKLKKVLSRFEMSVKVKGALFRPAEEDLVLYQNERSRWNEWNAGNGVG